MPYLVCEHCDVYYEVGSEEEITKFGNCECGNPLNYYESLELYLRGRGKIKKLPQHETIIGELLDLYESSVVKIILYAVKELPLNMRISRVTGFLKGSKSSFVTDNKLNELETYSVLSDFSTKKLEKLIGLLVKRDLLETRNVNPYPNMATVSLTEEGNRFIFNKDSLNLGFFENKHVDYLAGVDKELYEKLRALRYQISREKGFSAYMVCSNESLIEMAKKMPVNFKDMIKVKGIGKSFMGNYGERFLKVIKDYFG